MTAPSKRLALLFLLALVGVLAMIGAILGRAFGAAAATSYSVVVIVLLAAGSVLARRQQQRVADQARLAAGHTCTCCTGTVHDPVQVL